MAGAPQFSTDHFALKLGLFYAAYFFFGGVQLPFFPLWLEARGLDARMIGLVIAVPTLVRIVVTPIVTHQADRYGALKAMLVIGSIVGLLAMTVVGLVESAIAILVAFALAMAALAPMLSLSDAYALTGLAARGRNYGPVRLWGSVAFIAGNVGAGVILGLIAPGHLIWLIVSALVVVVLAAIALVPLDAGSKPVSDGVDAFAEDLAAQPGVSRGRAGVEHGAGQPRALLRLLHAGMARGRPRRRRDRPAVGIGRAGRDRAVCALRRACRRRCARPRCSPSAASAPSSAGPRWRSIRRWRCCRCCSSCTPPRSARPISAPWAFWRAPCRGNWRPRRRA